MVMATIAVYVAVGNLFGSRIPYANHFNVKVKANASQGVICINGNVVRAYLSNGNHLIVVGLKLHAYFYFLTSKSTDGHFLNEIRVAFAVAFFG